MYQLDRIFHQKVTQVIIIIRILLQEKVLTDKKKEKA